MTTLTCEQAFLRFFGYLDRALQGEELENLEAHLESCLSCCDKLAFSKKIDEFIKSRLPDQAVPDGLATRVKAALGPVHRFVDNRWYVDELYAWIVEHVQQNVARLCDAFDRWVIIGTLVNGSAWTTRAAGAVVARLQTGSVRAYALLFLAGVAALLALNL